MFGNFSEKAQKALALSKLEMVELKHPYIGTEHLLLGILKEGKNKVSDLLSKYGVTYEKFRKEIISKVGVGSDKTDLFIYTPLLKKIIEGAILDSKDDDGIVLLEHLFLNLLHQGEGVSFRILMEMGVDINRLYKELKEKTIIGEKKFFKQKSLLSELVEDFTEKAKNSEFDPVIGREKELQRIIEILLRRIKNNPILIGEAGVGKTAIVEELSRMIVKGEVPENLQGKRVLSLNMANIVAGTKYRGEFEEKVRKILDEIENDPDIILFIDEIHTIVGAGGAEGAIDASNIFKPALSRGKIKCIGATTIDEYRKFIEKDGALDRRFQKVLIKEPDEKTTKEIIYKLKPIYESYHSVKIPDEVLENIVKFSSRYFGDRRFPDKAIDLLDEACARVIVNKNHKIEELIALEKELEYIQGLKKQAVINQDFLKATEYRNKEKIILSKYNELSFKKIKKKKPKVASRDVASVVYEATGVPIYEILKFRKTDIKSLEKKLKSDIIGQDHVINKLLLLVKRIKLGLIPEEKPPVLMFLGNTGVGKTETAKKLSEHMFGKNSLIRLDMSEYKESHTISKIIGAPPGYVGYDDKNSFLEQVRISPYSVILLDEFEKAHPEVLDIFLRIFSEGKIKDIRDKEVDFRNTIIIITANINPKLLKGKDLGFINTTDDKKIDKSLKEIFKPELVNRIDDIILFNNLERSDLIKIAKKEINKIKEMFLKRGISINISDEVIEKIVDESNYKEYGVRDLKRLIQKEIEDKIIDLIIEDNNIDKINIKYQGEFLFN